MTNIWAESYSKVREPFFEMMDPYTLNEKKDNDEKEEKNNKAGEDEEHKYKKTGKKSKDYDGDGEVEDESHEYAGVKDKAIKKAMRKEERELSSKSLKTDKVDVKSGIRNKIKINPSIGEEVNAWIESLVEEGYDLSQFTLDEIVEIYESVESGVLDEADTSTMPARGDAQTVKKDPLESAKRRAAQAQVRKEIADTQLARARATSNTTNTNESVITYLISNNYISEAVFDSKKSKLRPASERTQRTMTDADRRAAKQKQSKSERLEQEADRILNKMRSSGGSRRSAAPMGTQRTEKPKAPEANRKLDPGKKKDTLSQKAGQVLKDLKK